MTIELESSGLLQQENAMTNEEIESTARLFATVRFKDKRLRDHVDNQIKMMQDEAAKNKAKEQIAQEPGNT